MVSTRWWAAAVLVVGVLAGSTIPAAAAPPPEIMDFEHTDYRVFFAPFSREQCNDPDAQDYDIGGQVKMTEKGRHGVIRMEAEFQLFATDTGPGYNPKVLRQRYVSRGFNDTSYSNSMWLPNGVWHNFPDLPATHTWELRVKMIWVRGGARLNWVHTARIAYCPRQ